MITFSTSLFHPFHGEITTHFFYLVFWLLTPYFIIKKKYTYILVFPFSVSFYSQRAFLFCLLIVPWEGLLVVPWQPDVLPNVTLGHSTTTLTTFHSQYHLMLVNTQFLLSDMVTAFWHSDQ